MQKPIHIAKTILLSAVLLSASIFFPLSSFASPGVHAPTGASAGTYTYNKDTSLWENAHYTYDPDTGVTSPIKPIEYTYNPATSMWDFETWVYSVPNGDYVSQKSSINEPPLGSIKIGGPKPVVTPTDSGNNNSNSPQNSSQGDVNSSNPAIDGSNNNGSTINGSAINNINDTNNTNGTINNNLNSTSLTGDANVNGNTSAGNATTGNAQAMANVVNMLQSSTAFSPGGNGVSFVSNINGDVNGDFLLDPAKLSTIQPAGNTNLNNQLNVNLNNNVNGQIKNNITLGANSGNADVSKNTLAGNATTGSASAVANVMNVINSAITSGKSFLGVVNINGNLNGDILLPPSFIDQLIAAKVPSTTIDTSTLNTTVGVTNNNNQSVVNNVGLSANSGNANVAGNTSAGSARSGSAGTNLNVFNLTGSNIVGTNDLLVFVNVLGTWVGMIVNAPAGSTAAELGGGITQNTTANIAATNNTNEKITNNINLASQSGDANVAENTKAGNATSGNATASANIANILGSKLDLSNWFGVLFINVFGTWHGSFGVNTDAGNPIEAGPVVAMANANNSLKNTKVFSFVPTGDKNKFKVAPASFNDSNNNEAGTTASLPQIAALTDHINQFNAHPVSNNKIVHHDMLMPMFGGILGASLLGTERVVSTRKNRKK